MRTVSATLLQQTFTERHEFVLMSFNLALYTVRAEQQFAKMQVWLGSGDRILVAEAQQFFTAQAQPELVSLVSTAVVALELPEGGSSEEAVMPGGFGRSQPQRRSGKTALQEIR